MKVGSLIIAIFCFLNISLINEVEEIIPVNKNGKYGYINFDGKVIIKHQYLSAYNFSEGLACARKEGLFGYINKKGEWVIQPQYDFGTAFSNGAALVWVDGAPRIIDRKGNVLHHGNKEYDASNLGNGLFSFQLDTILNLINSKGKTLQYNKKKLLNCRKLNNDQVIIYKSRANSTKVLEDYYDCALINGNGELIIPFGKFLSIRPGINKQIIGTAYSKENSKYSIYLDSNLNFIGKVNCNNIGDGFSEGLLEAYYYPDSENKNYKSQGMYLNKNGDTVLSNPQFEFVNPFKNGVALVSSHDSGYYLINKNGKRISKNGYDYFYNQQSTNGKFVAKKGEKHFILDTSGKEVFKFDDNTKVERLIENRFIICGHRIKNDWRNKLEENHFSLFNLNGEQIIPFKKGMHFSGISRTKNIYAQKDDKYFIFSSEGKLIWESRLNTQDKWNLDYRARRYYSVKSKRHKSDLGGHAKSTNHSSPIEKHKGVKKGTLGLLYQPEKRKNNLIVYNTSSETKFFSGINSCLYLCLEAKNKNGKWQAVEMYPRSFCGNSYHTLQLPIQEQWTLNTKSYEGVFKTKLRYSLEVLESEPKKRSWDKQSSYFIYSKEFKGSVNPAQFWRTRTYNRHGIMDAGY